MIDIIDKLLEIVRIILVKIPYPSNILVLFVIVALIIIILVSKYQKHEDSFEQLDKKFEEYIDKLEKSLEEKEKELKKLEAENIELKTKIKEIKGEYDRKISILKSYQEKFRKLKKWKDFLRDVAEIDIDNLLKETLFSNGRYYLLYFVGEGFPLYRLKNKMENYLKKLKAQNVQQSDIERCKKELDELYSFLSKSIDNITFNLSLHKQFFIKKGAVYIPGIAPVIIRVGNEEYLDKLFTEYKDFVRLLRDKFVGILNAFIKNRGNLSQYTIYFINRLINKLKSWSIESPELSRLRIKRVFLAFPIYSLDKIKILNENIPFLEDASLLYLESLINNIRIAVRFTLKKIKLSSFVRYTDNTISEETLSNLSKYEDAIFKELYVNNICELARLFDKDKERVIAVIQKYCNIEREIIERSIMNIKDFCKTFLAYSKSRS